MWTEVRLGVRRLALLLRLLRIVRLLMVSIFYCRLFINAALRCPTLIRCTSFINVLSNTRSINCDRNNANLRRFLRNVLRRAFTLNVGDQYYLIRSGSEEVLRSNANCTRALTLASKRSTTAVASSNVRAVFQLNGRLMNVNCLYHVNSVFVNDVNLTRTSVILRTNVRRSYLLICVACRLTRVICNGIFRVSTISRRLTLLCVMMTEGRIRRYALSTATLSRRYSNLSLEGRRVSVLRCVGRLVILVINVNRKGVTRLCLVLRTTSVFEILLILSFSLNFRGLISALRAYRSL